MSQTDKTGKLDMLEKYFNTRAWKRVEIFKLDELRTIHDRIAVDIGEKPVYGTGEVTMLNGMDLTGVSTESSETPF